MSNTAKKSKTTFRVSRKSLEDFQYYMKALGLRRDRYLNRVLPIAIGWLSQAKANSSVAERFWKSMRDVKAKSFRKVAITLDSDLVKSMNSVCAEKRIPRDYFFQTFLETLVEIPENGNGPAPLPSALSLINDPWEQWGASFSGETPFDHIILDDFDEEDLEELLQNVSSELAAKGGSA